MVYSRAVLAAEDVAITTHDFEGPDLDATSAITLGDNFRDYWLAIRDRFTPSTSLQEVRFYNGYNGDGSPGDVDFVRPILLPGQATGNPLPPQCACSVTEELYQGGLGIVDERRHWGRWYLPAPAQNVVGSDGRYVNGFVLDMATFAKQFLDACKADGWTPGIWIKPPSSPTPVLAEVDGVRVDDIVDIIRRRRWEQFVNRHVLDLA